MDEIARHGISDPFWTFGGGTVLMLRHGHRLSKDIDIFVPDPQYLGFVSPRMSDAAERVTQDYVEGPGYVKLLRPEGEIDFVASPNLRAGQERRGGGDRRQTDFIAHCSEVGFENRPASGPGH